MLPHSESCERNKGPILEVLRKEYESVRSVLEIGSGTAQHAVHFARHLPHLSWQPSDLSENISIIQTRLQREATDNLLQPLLLDVCRQPWPIAAIDAVFTANTMHIMSWRHVERFFDGVATVLSSNGRLCVYGPFKYNNDFTSKSNAEFDIWLKQRDPLSGIRDFEALDDLAKKIGLSLRADHAMPANNQLLVWKMR